MVILVAAGLLVASLGRVFRVDPGLDPRNVIAFRLPLPQADFYGEPERTEFCAEMTRLVGAVPGVAAVGAVSHVPLSGANAGRGFVIEGRAAPAPGEQPGANYGVSCPGYFPAMGIPITAGRDFALEDGLNAPRVAIVNEALERRYFPSERALGKRIKLGGFDSDAPWLTIIGVVGDVRHVGLQSEIEPYLYRPYSQSVWPAMSVMVRGREGPAFPASAVRSALQELAPDQPVGDAVAMMSTVERSLGYLRFPMRLLSAFALIAVVLAAAGIFGVASQAVVRRTREFGIRAAIGATPGSLYRLILAQAMRPVVVGLVLGTGGALAATRLLEGLLFGVTRTDLRTYLAVSALLAGAALVASAMPAFGASRRDPLEALRHE
jgi:predicted permease